MFSRAIGLAAALVAGCAAVVTDPLEGRTVDPSYAEGGGVFGTGAQITVRAGTFEEAGRVAVCAAWAGDGIDTTAIQYVDFVLDTGVVQLGGTNVLQGLSRFPEAPSRSALDGAPAGCVLTGTAWRPDFAGMAPRIRFARLTLGADVEEGVDTYFRGR